MSAHDAPRLPGHLFAAERCLDGQLAARLTRHFRCSHDELPGGLEGALRLWQWERLCRTALRAAMQSQHYKTRLGRQGAADAIQAAALASGVPVPDGCGPERHDSAPITGTQHPPESLALRHAVGRLLARLPHTLPGELAAAPESFLAVGHNDVAGLISLPTSGTTGAGKRIFCTESDLEETAAFFHHGMRYMVEPGGTDHVALLMSGERPGSIGDLLLRGMAALGVPCSVPGFVRPGAEDAMLDRLVESAPTCLVGVPGQILSLARHERARELARHVRAVLLSGDAAALALREGIAQGLSCKVFVHYGLTETGLGGAVECREHSGPHMREADLLFEVLDEGETPLPPGAWGEIAVTTLTRQALPLLRYKTGDEGRIVPGDCACGSVLGRIEARGRISQSLLLPSGKRLPLTGIDSLLYALPFVRQYTATMHIWKDEEKERRCLCLDLRVVGQTEATALDAARQALAVLPETTVAPEADGGCSAWPERLPILLRIMKGDGDVTMPPQAKQRIRYADQPSS